METKHIAIYRHGTFNTTIEESTLKDWIVNNVAPIEGDKTCTLKQFRGMDLLHPCNPMSKLLKVAKASGYDFKKVA